MTARIKIRKEKRMGGRAKVVVGKGRRGEGSSGRREGCGRSVWIRRPVGCFPLVGLALGYDACTTRPPT